MDKFIIPGNVPSSKNGKTSFLQVIDPKQVRAVRVKNRWVVKGVRSYLVPRSNVTKYKKNTAGYWTSLRNKFIKAVEQKNNEFPNRTSKVIVRLVYYRDSKRKFDLINATQIIQDLMVEHKWIEDDNADELLPIFGGYDIDRKNPRIEIEVK